MNKRGMSGRARDLVCKTRSLLPRNRSGQVTIFIILALIIVVAGVLIYLFYPQIKTSLGTAEKNPEAYIQSCIEQDIRDAVEKISSQGGSLNPLNYIMYNNSKVEYLCYTSEYYVPCVVQQPMLKQHIESEIKNEIEENVDACFTSMKESYEKRGYDVTLKSGDKRVELFPKKIVSTFDYSLTLTKGSTEEHKPFVVVLDNNLYEFAAIANSIIEWETTYGDVAITTYMNYYHNLKAEKITKGSGEKIYILTNRDTGNKFQFATRGQIWPEGYVMPATT